MARAELVLSARRCSSHQLREHLQVDRSASLIRNGHVSTRGRQREGGLDSKAGLGWGGDDLVAIMVMTDDVAHAQEKPLPSVRFQTDG